MKYKTPTSVIEREVATHCFSCGVNIENSRKRYGFHEFTNGNNWSHVFIRICCDVCADTYESISEAINNDVPFSGVGIYPSIGVPFGESQDYCEPLGGSRCACGKSSYRKKETINEWKFNIRPKEESYCINCGKTIRMLGRLEREKKIIQNSLRELRREIKNQTQLIGA